MLMMLILFASFEVKTYSYRLQSDLDNLTFGAQLKKVQEALVHKKEYIICGILYRFAKTRILRYPLICIWPKITFQFTYWRLPNKPRTAFDFVKRCSREFDDLYETQRCYKQFRIVSSGLRWWIWEGIH